MCKKILPSQVLQLHLNLSNVNIQMDAFSMWYVEMDTKIMESELVKRQFVFLDEMRHIVGGQEHCIHDWTDVQLVWQDL